MDLHRKLIIPIAIATFGLIACSLVSCQEKHVGTEPDQSVPFSSVNDGTDPYVEQEEKGRVEREASTTANTPSNAVDESVMPDAPEGSLSVGDGVYSMDAFTCKLTFSLSEGHYEVSFLSNGEEMYRIETPLKLYIKGEGQLSGKYSSIRQVRYGYILEGRLSSASGGEYLFTDRYYFPEGRPSGAINVQRHVSVLAPGSDKGYQSIYGIDSDASTDSLQWYVPNQVFGDFPDQSTQKYRVYRETLTGLPLAMMYDKERGFAVSLARYRPVIDYQSNSFACVGIHYGLNSSSEEYSSVEVTYPTRDTARRYFSPSLVTDIVYDLTIIAGSYEDYGSAMVDVYDKQFALESPRLIDADMDEVYELINEDFKSFMQSNTANGITSYGLPWRVSIDSGKIGPQSYQAGFVGQQLPCAYNMMVYGLRNNDQEALKNGQNIINFWVNDAEMVTSSGVPKIWYFGDSNTWAGYPTFLRMAVDAMEAVLDAYRLSSRYGLGCSGWKAAFTSVAEWLVNAQNEDGSWYRCYNYQGTYYKGTESDITWNPGDIARSTSKNNTTIPVRFLAKMYEFTGETKYLDAVKKAGEFIYENLYPQHVYYGGTCDNPDAVDKEAGVFAMYAYDALYTLTGEERWLKCLEEATAFAMSSVIAISFKIPDSASTQNVANPYKYGYTEGLSYICIGGTSLDNFAAYMYYQLFREYIYTGKDIYLMMAEFIQQDTKGTMDYDGKLGFSYRSLTPEASTIYSFGFDSATDDEGVKGVWLPWQSAANAEPIAKMYDVFGQSDVAKYKDTPIEDLRTTLRGAGVGGHTHGDIK